MEGLSAACSALTPFGIRASWPRTAVCTQGTRVPVPTLPVLLYTASGDPRDRESPPGFLRHWPDVQPGFQSPRHKLSLASESL